MILIDEFTGRMMHGRRLSEGLHQAIEAKEGVKVQPENQTLASITFQNYFRLYDKLGGMTGTAATEATEFGDIYKLDVIEIPTNRPVMRHDDDDEVYRTAKEKYNAIIADIEETHRKQQPVLVGTVSIEKSEYLSTLLKQRGIPHQVLNARYHEQEAQIVAQAGVPGAVTIATNMAGRGTDIQLGGNLDMRMKAALKGDETPEQIALLRRQIGADVEQKKRAALDAGGLYVLGTERHESRRIDNQLRGRTGRQGDPGKSKFYICLEDDLLRIFAAERLDAIMRGLGIQEGEAIVHPWMNKALETSQRRVEQRNFEIRKNLLKYDDVINDQRKAIFEQRIEFMRTADVAPIVKDMRHDVVEKLVWRHMPEKAYPEQWNTPELMIEAEEIFGFALAGRPLGRRRGHRPAGNHRAADARGRSGLCAESGDARARAPARGGKAGAALGGRHALARALELARPSALRDPFARLRPARSAERVQDRSVHAVRAHAARSAHHRDAHAAAAADRPGRGSNCRSRWRRRTPTKSTRTRTPAKTKWRVRDERASLAPDGFDRHDPRTWGKVSRNAPCPCGSGKKFKYCHGTAEAASA